MIAVDSSAVWVSRPKPFETPCLDRMAPVGNRCGYNPPYVVSAISTGHSMLTDYSVLLGCHRQPSTAESMFSVSLMTENQAPCELCRPGVFLKLPSAATKFARFFCHTDQDDKAVTNSC